MSSALPHGLRPAKSPDVRDELLADGSMVLFHTGSRRLLTINPTAALVWECCDGAHTEDDIVVELREVFPEATAIVEDVRAILFRFSEHGMLQPPAA
jgi:hypothetical protein